MTEKKRILILTADAGFGHRSAAKAIAEALGESRAADCEVSIVNPLDNPKTPPWLRESQNDYDRLARDMPELYKLGYDLSDTQFSSKFMDNVMRVLLYPSIKESVGDFQPDAIVSTYPFYAAPLDALATISRRRIPLVTVVTDLATVHQIWFSGDADLTVAPTPAVRDLAIGAGVPAAKVEVIGIPVHPRIVRETRGKEELRDELGWERDRFTILAVGSKRVGKMREVLNAINHAGFPVQLAIAAGGDEERYDEFQKNEWHVPTHIYNFVRNLPTMMRAADCVIAKAGGLIVTEALAASLPLLLIDVLPGQEVGNAEYVVNGGAGELVTDSLGAVEAICHWLENDRHRFREASAAAAGLGRPRAAYDIADRAWEFAQRGPESLEPLQTQVRNRLRELFSRFGANLEE